MKLLDRIVGKICKGTVHSLVEEKMLVKEQEAEQTVRDAEQISRWLKGTLLFAYGVNFDNLKKHGGRYFSMRDEKRLLEALKLLKSRGYISWGGNRGDQIGFNKNTLPTRL